MGADKDDDTLLDIMGFGEFSTKKSYYRELTEANAYAEAILDASTVNAIISTDLNGVIKKFNTGAQRMLGYKASDLENLKTPELFHLKSEVEARSRELSDEYGEEVRGFDVFIYNAARNGSENREWTYITRSGEHLTVNLTVTSILNSDRQIVGYLGIARDITEEKKTQKRLDEAQNMILGIMDSLPSIIMAVSESFKITLFNKNAARIAKSEDLNGRDMFDLFPQVKEIEEELRKSALNKRVLYNRFVFHRENGDRIYRDFLFSPMISDTTVGVIRIDDVTDRVKMEENLAQSEKMVSIGGLAAGMAHEINNPIAGMTQNAQNLERRLFSNISRNQETADRLGLDLNLMSRYLRERDIDKMIKNIKISGTRVTEIVHNMLSFSKRSNNAFIPVDLESVIEKTINIIKNDNHFTDDVDFSKIRFNRDYEQQLEPVRCDSSKIELVLYNLLKNGAEAMYKEENPEFRIKTRKDGIWHLITIEDNGTGMDEEVSKRIFEPFYTTKGHSNGTGLGMALSYFIISDLHKGEIYADSEKGKWTRFTIKLNNTL